MAKKARELGTGAVILGGLALWALTKKEEPAAAAPPAVTKPPAVIPFLPLPIPVPKQLPVSKQPVVEQPKLPLETWQTLTPEQLATLPVDPSVNIPIGPDTYNPTPAPIAIVDTGFTIWGRTGSGATVVSKNEPSSYPAWEWM